MDLYPNKGRRKYAVNFLLSFYYLLMIYLSFLFPLPREKRKDKVLKILLTSISLPLINERTTHSAFSALHWSPEFKVVRSHSGSDYGRYSTDRTSDELLRQVDVVTAIRHFGERDGRMLLRRRMNYTLSNDRKMTVH